MHGVNVAEANVKYTGSTKLQEDAVHHVIDIFDAEFNPKMNQNDVVIANPLDACSTLSNKDEISGKIVLIEDGSLTTGSDCNLSLIHISEPTRPY